jgi:putative ABC transport system substrate-binding protein
MLRIGLTWLPAAWPLTARAQQPAMPAIGFLRSTSPDGAEQLLAAFRDGLKGTGFVEGQTGDRIPLGARRC